MLWILEIFKTCDEIYNRIEAVWNIWIEVITSQLEYLLFHAFESNIFVAL